MGSLLHGSRLRSVAMVSLLAACGGSQFRWRQPPTTLPAGVSRQGLRLTGRPARRSQTNASVARRCSNAYARWMMSSCSNRTSLQLPHLQAVYASYRSPCRTSAA